MIGAAMTNSVPCLHCTMASPAAGYTLPMFRSTNTVRYIQLQKFLNAQMLPYIKDQQQRQIHYQVNREGRAFLC